MACGETVEEVSPMQGGASKEEPDSETDAGAEMDSDTELPLTMPTDERGAGIRRTKFPYLYMYEYLQ